ncbi:MAG: prepilin-type N-terminal cleavage/methylation domain-containing protein [Planctomycetota bacterium]|nr:MAG: prepilin-type N-terminal cleavage/methylation domain-containing protein [Planctomycetota bacterium]
MKYSLRNRAARAARRGFTLIELCATVGILGLVTLSVHSVADSSDRLSKYTTVRARMLGQGNEALTRATAELSNAGISTLSAGAWGPSGASTVDFLVVTGSNGDDPIWSTTRRLGVILSDGEIDNGLDDDSDGLVDERRLVFVRDAGGAGQKQIVLCNNLCETFPGESINGADDNGNGLIDETGFCAFVTGNGVELRIALQAQDGEGGVLTETFVTRVYPRN